MRNIAITAAIAAGALALAGCGAAISKTPAAPASTTAAAQAASAPAPSPTSSAPLTGGIGTSFTVTTGDGSSYDVTLDQVEQHAAAGPYEAPQNAGDHFAAAQFTITGVSGSTSDDANNDASAVGSDEQQYQSSDATLTVPNFDSGMFNVGPGQSVKGWVALELPPGVTVASVQWAPGFNGSAATWNLGG